MKRWIVAFLACAVGLGGFSAAAQPAATTVAAGPLKPEELYSARRLNARISPSGRYLALVQRVAEKDRLVVIDLQERTRSEIYNDPTFAFVTIENVHWKGDERLIFSRSAFNLAKDNKGQVKSRKREGETVGVMNTWEPENPFSVARTGGPLVPLNAVKAQMFMDFLGASKLDDEHVFVAVVTWPSPFRDSTNTRMKHNQGRIAQLYKVNVVTGKAELAEDGGDRTRYWGVDQNGRVNLRYDVYGRRGGLRVYGRGEGEAWRELFSTRGKDVPAPEEMEILGQTSTPGRLYVAIRPTDRTEGDTIQLRIFDFATKSFGEKVWAHPKYDLVGIGQDESGALTAACYVAETFRCDYLDPAKQAEAEAVRKFFDDEREIRILSKSRDDRLRILAVSGPDEPGSLYLHDRTLGKVDLLGPQWPRLAPDRMGVMKAWTWSAKDGASLSGYLTTPPPMLGAQGPLPLIVMPHGGPEVRDTLSFDRWGQAFASRGYLVFQPNFRGSGGFGAAFAEQGYGQWGQRMQQDVIDGVEALIKQGKVDPNRICIVGASYGGYVALQGGATRPDLFKCVVARAGVSDLIRSQEWEKDTFDADSPRYQYWLKSIGDPKADAEKLKTASPITYAADYGPPVLLLHGEEDWIVPIEQSRMMEKALKRAGKPVTLVEYKTEGHAGWSDHNEIVSLQQMLTFVEGHIGRK